MAQITNYQTLQDNVADLLNRGDLTSQIPVFIQLFEAKLKDDERARKLTDRGTITISADGLQLPSDLQSVEAWYHDSDTFRGPISVVTHDQIPLMKARHGYSGVPAFAAIVDGKARFAPAPDGTYTTYMLYWRSVAPLSASNTSNWLLAARPDIYLYGAAMQAAPYLKDDQRIAVWASFVEDGLESLHLATEREQFGGRLKRHVRTIGG